MPEFVLEDFMQELRAAALAEDNLFYLREPGSTGTAVKRILSAMKTTT